MKLKYSTPECDVIALEDEDIITTSIEIEGDDLDLPTV